MRRPPGVVTSRQREIRFTPRAPVCYSIAVMRLPLRWVLTITGILFVAGTSQVGVRTVSGAEASMPAPRPAEVTLRQVHLIETRDGSRLWELWADRAEVHEREGYAVLSRITRPVEVTLYSGEGQLRCTANRATVDLATKNVRLEGEVFGRSDQGVEIRTESVRWLAASRRLQTDQPVTVSRGGMVSRGRGLEADTDLEQVRIFQNITSQLRPAATPVAPAVRPAAKPAGRKAAP